jgi:hypothetical protein
MWRSENRRKPTNELFFDVWCSDPTSDIARDLQEFEAIGVIKQNDKYTGFRNSLDNGLKSKNGSAMHQDGVTCVRLAGHRNIDRRTKAIVFQIWCEEKFAKASRKQLLRVERLVPSEQVPYGRIHGACCIRYRHVVITRVPKTGRSAFVPRCSMRKNCFRMRVSGISHLQRDKNAVLEKALIAGVRNLFKDGAEQEVSRIAVFEASSWVEPQISTAELGRKLLNAIVGSARGSI